MATTAKLLAGVDLGKATASFALAALAEDGTLPALSTECVRHLGDPVGVFCRRYREWGPFRLAGLALTGVFAEGFQAPAIAGVPEEIAQEIAAGHLYPDGPLNLVRLGARGYSILTRGPDGNYSHQFNDKCSSGAGETMERICSRFGLSLEQAAALAEAETQGIAITARCSVFAKTELTHFANQGAPHSRLLRGYFESVARNLASLFEKFGVEGPVILIGNAATLPPVVRALQEQIGQPVRVAPEAAVFEAIGALHLAWDQRGSFALPFPEDPSGLVRVRQRKIQSLPAPARVKGSVLHLSEDPPPEDPSAPAVLGLDLGSTGSKAAMLDLKTGSVLADVYRRTDGNPVEAAKALVAEITAMVPNPVVRVGLTGSGRDAAATVFRAAFPGREDRITVLNEIVAHARAACRYDPEAGKSLSIVEIGGQDAKFINLEQGRILESDMNRACSAGTGSFLEEQALFYGIGDLVRFGEMAGRAQNPPDLGQTCTVFVADLAAEALNEGYTLEDIFAGFQYSVIINYKNRVMGARRFLDRIFFQGKPASAPSLARALAAITGRDVVVPPNPGAMGAIGIALLAAEQGPAGETLDLGKVLAAEITDRRTFQCRDSTCRNLCRIESATVAVAGSERKVLSGGNCPKYEKVAALGKKLPPDAPNAYREREALLAPYLQAPASGQAPTLGLPNGHCLTEFIPFFHTFFSESGLAVEVAQPDREKFYLGDQRCSASNCCSATKIMHGLARADLDFLFLPKIVTLPKAIPGAGASTCPLTQAAPEMIEHALLEEGASARVVRPILHLAQGFRSRKFFRPLLQAGREIFPGLKLTRALRAFRIAERKQIAYQRELMEIGRRSLAYAREQGYPVALMVGNPHVIHDPVMNAGIHDLLTRNGAIAIPLDCFPVPETVPPLKRVYWSIPNRTLRACLAAVEQGNIFPLLILSYGCGPGSFLEHLFNDLLEGYPHTVLETDGHGGQAGYVTRVQAFLHSVHADQKPAGPVINPERIQSYDRLDYPSLEELRAARIKVFPVGPNLGAHITASLRGRGYDAQFAGLTDAAGFKNGRGVCTGKECLPYQLIWGAFKQSLDQDPPMPGRKTLLLNVTGFGPCRNGMFTLGNEIALRRLGLADRVETATFGAFDEDPGVLAGTWLSIVGTDVLNLMRLYLRPKEPEPGTADRIFQDYSDRLEELLLNGNHAGRGLAGMMPRHLVKAAEDLLSRAAKEYQALANGSSRRKDLRTVFLAGDVYLRIDEWGSGDLTRVLNAHGLRVISEPFAEIYEYLAKSRSRELMELEDRWLLNRLMRLAMKWEIRRLYASAVSSCPWVQSDPVAEVERESRLLLDGTPLSEAVLTIGSALLAWRTRPVDGVVVVNPWGCGPALISEAQLRRRSSEIPLLFVYNDGDPIDEARIAGFAWRLRRRPARNRLTVGS